MNEPLDTTFERFFETKTRSDVRGAVACRSPDLATYTDDTRGWDLESRGADGE